MKVFSVIVDLSISPFPSVFIPGIWAFYGLDTFAMHPGGLILFINVCRLFWCLGGLIL